MKIILCFFAGFVLVFVYVRYMESVSLFHPSRRITVTPKEAGLAFEDIYFSTADHVRLNAWLVKRATRPEEAATVLFCHGNAGNLSDRVAKLTDFRNAGLNVFILDYRGFGKSQGRTTEKGMYADVKAAYDYLQTRPDIAKNKIILYGASMGGAAAIDLASKEPVAALIVDSTFTSSIDMAKRIAPLVPSFMLAVKLDSVSKIKKISAPKLFIHSPDDETVPFWMGKKLFDLASEPKEFLQIIGSHSEGYALSEGIFLPGFENFLDKHGLR